MNIKEIQYIVSLCHDGYLGKVIKKCFLDYIIRRFRTVLGKFCLFLNKVSISLYQMHPRIVHAQRKPGLLEQILPWTTLMPLAEKIRIRIYRILPGKVYPEKTINTEYFDYSNF